MMIGKNLARKLEVRMVDLDPWNPLSILTLVGGKEFVTGQIKVALHLVFHVGNGHLCSVFIEVYRHRDHQL
jgi:hypothetical protein